MSEELNKQLQEKVSNIRKAVAEAQAFAEANKLSFGLNFGYGMGGTYGPIDGEPGWDGHICDPDYYDTDEEYEEALANAEYGWYTSSMSC